MANSTRLSVTLALCVTLVLVANTASAVKPKIPDAKPIKLPDLKIPSVPAPARTKLPPPKAEAGALPSLGGSKPGIERVQDAIPGKRVEPLPGLGRDVPSRPATVRNQDGYQGARTNVQPSSPPVRRTAADYADAPPVRRTAADYADAPAEVRPANVGNSRPGIERVQDALPGRQVEALPGLGRDLPGRQVSARNTDGYIGTRANPAPAPKQAAGDYAIADPSIFKNSGGVSAPVPNVPRVRRTAADYGSGPPEIKQKPSSFLNKANLGGGLTLAALGIGAPLLVQKLVPPDEAEEQ